MNRFTSLRADHPLFVPFPFVSYAGAGAVLSAGLLKAVSLEFMELCTKSLYSSGAPPPFPLPWLVPCARRLMQSRIMRLALGEGLM